MDSDIEESLRKRQRKHPFIGDSFSRKVSFSAFSQIFVFLKCYFVLLTVFLLPSNDKFDCAITKEARCVFLRILCICGTKTTVLCITVRIARTHQCFFFGGVIFFMLLSLQLLWFDFYARWIQSCENFAATSTDLGMSIHHRGSGKYS